MADISHIVARMQGQIMVDVIETSTGLPREIEVPA